MLKRGGRRGVTSLEGHAQNVNDAIESVELRGGGEEVGVDGGGEEGFVVGEAGVVRGGSSFVGGGVIVEGVGFGTVAGGCHGCLVDRVDSVIDDSKEFKLLVHDLLQLKLWDQRNQLQSSII